MEDEYEALVVANPATLSEVHGDIFQQWLDDKSVTSATEERLKKQLGQFAEMSRADIAAAMLPKVNSSDAVAVAHYNKMLDILNLLMTKDSLTNESQHTKRLQELLHRETLHHYRMFEVLEGYLQEPTRLATQHIWRFDQETEAKLLASYYAFDATILKEMLCNKFLVSSLMRPRACTGISRYYHDNAVSPWFQNEQKAVAALERATNNSVSRRSCRRQYTNLLRVRAVVYAITARQSEPTLGKSPSFAGLSLRGDCNQTELRTMLRPKREDLLTAITRSFRLPTEYVWEYLCALFAARHNLWLQSAAENIVGKYRKVLQGLQWQHIRSVACILMTYWCTERTWSDADFQPDAIARAHTTNTAESYPSGRLFDMAFDPALGRVVREVLKTKWHARSARGNFNQKIKSGLVDATDGLNRVVRDLTMSLIRLADVFDGGSHRGKGPKTFYLTEFIYMVELFNRAKPVPHADSAPNQDMRMFFSAAAQSLDGALDDGRRICWKRFVHAVEAVVLRCSQALDGMAPSPAPPLDVKRSPATIAAAAVSDSPAQTNR